jgi:hypothetical protein
MQHKKNITKEKPKKKNMKKQCKKNTKEQHSGATLKCNAKK